MQRLTTRRQPFLVPVPPASTSGLLQTIVHALGYVLSVFRSLTITAIVLLYVLLVEFLSLVLVGHHSPLASVRNH